MDNNRKIAYLVLMDIEDKKAYSHLALNYHISVGKPSSEAFVRKLVYGVLENKIYLDHIIAQFLDSPSSKLQSSERTILRMGIYQLDNMDSVPDYAAVKESVTLAKRYAKGRDGMVNGILRNYVRDKERVTFPDKETDLLSYLSVMHSYAPWIVSLWLEEFGPATTEELMIAGNKTPDLMIRHNRLRTTKSELHRRLEAKGYEVTVGRLAKDALHVKGSALLRDNLYQDGMFSVQDESSMVVVSVLDPQPGETIVDVCAAPGGKAVYIAECMDNRGIVYAQDLYKKKIELIKKEAERVGVNILEPRTWDATRTDGSLEEIADRVLVDAPCSGLGVVRRKPEIKYKEWDTEIDQLPDVQLAILSAASRYVKKSGILVYSTCTINPAENQKVVNAFLKGHSSFVVEDSIQLMPHINDTDGFFICRMRRNG
jgi:16S rRNA (cytosine967-C5)-methyltransferase